MNEKIHLDLCQEMLVFDPSIIHYHNKSFLNWLQNVKKILLKSKINNRTVFKNHTQLYYVSATNQLLYSASIYDASNLENLAALLLHNGTKKLFFRKITAFHETELRLSD